MIEHEAKILEVDEDNLSEKLEGIGANKILNAVTYIEGYDFSNAVIDTADYVGRFEEIKTHVDNLRNAGTMFEQGAYLRLREEGKRNELIFKQKTRESSRKVKSEIEISVPIEGNEWKVVAELLSVWGLERIVIQEKKRVSFVYGDYRYDLDTWPGVPTYLEVEAPTQDDVLAALKLINIDPQLALSISASEVFVMYKIENPRKLLFR